jgi:hypothetical protein
MNSAHPAVLLDGYRKFKYLPGSSLLKIGVYVQ